MEKKNKKIKKSISFFASKRRRVLTAAVLVFLIAISVFGAVKFGIINKQKSNGELPRVKVDAKDVFSVQGGTASGEKGSAVNFKANENPTFNIVLPSAVPKEAKPTSFLNNWLGTKSADAAESRILKAEVLNNDNFGNIRDDIKTSVSDTENGASIQVLKNEGSFRPGDYKLKIEMLSPDGKQILTSSQEFSWGVLSVNTNKSIYAPGETAYLQMASLNEYGHGRCNSDLELKVTNSTSGVVETFSTQDGTMQKNGDCEESGIRDNVTDLPDYFAYYQVSQEGSYQMQLTNLDTGYAITDSFEVKENVPFEVERFGATRINPFKSTYQMSLNVKANQDFNGEIVEKVPSGFEITNANGGTANDINGEKEIAWNLELKKGEQKTLQYEYQAPKVSPEIFLLGPMEMRENGAVVFQEERQWQIASDTAINASATGNWNATTTWTPAQVPTVLNGDDVSIGNVGTYTVTVNAGGLGCHNITMYTNGTLTAGGSLRTLTVSGYVSGTGGTLTGPSSTTGFTINLGGNWTFSSTLSGYVSLNINGSADQTINGSVGLRYTYVASSGGIVYITATPTSAAARTVFTSGNVVYNYSGTTQAMLPANHTGNVTFSGSGAKTMTSVTSISGSLTISNPCTAALANGLAIGGNLAIDTATSTGVTMASASTITVTGNVTGNGIWTTGTTNSARTISLQGNWSFNGTSTGNRAAATFTGSNTQTLSGKISTGTNNAANALTVNKSGGSLTLGSAITVNVFTLTAGTFDASTYLLTFTTPTFTAGTMRVGGANWAGNYSGAITEPAAGIIEYYAAGAQAVNDIAYPGSLKISGSGTKTWTLGAARTITGNLTILDGPTLSIAGAWAFTVTGTTTVGEGNSGILSIDNATGTKTFTNTVAINAGGAITETAAAAISFGSNATIDGTLTIVGTLTPNAASIISGGGTLTGTGTVQVTKTSATADFSSQYTVSTKTLNNLTVNYTANNQVVSALAYGLLTLDGGGNAYTTGGSFSASSTFTNNGTLTPGAGDVISGGGTLTGTGTVKVTKTTATADFSSQYTITNKTYTNLTVEYTANNQVVSALAYGKLTLDAGGGNAYTTGGSFSASSTFTNNGTLTPGASDVISGGGTLTGTGTVKVTKTTATADFSSQYTITNKTYTNLTVEYSGSSNQIVSNVAYSNLKISTTGGASATLAGSTTITANLTISTGAILDNSPANKYDFTLAGNWSNSGTFTSNSGGTVTLNGTGAQALSGNMTVATSSAFNNLTITNTSGASAGVAFSDDITVAGTFTDTPSTVASKVIFAVNKIYAFASINIHGTASYAVILDSSRGGSHGAAGGPQWTFNVTQTSPTVSFVTVYDSDATGSSHAPIDATNNGTDGGNNEGWNLAPPVITEFISIVDPGGSSDSDYSNLNDWNNGVATNLILTTTKVFAGTRYGAGLMTDNLTVTGQSSNATATIVHANAARNQILLEGISGTFQNGENILLDDDHNQYFFTSNTGDSASAVAKCRTTTGAADTTEVTIDNWTTDSTHYIKIWTDPSENYRHQGVWDTSKYRIEISSPSSNGILRINEPYTQVEGLQLMTVSPDSAERYGLVVGAGGTTVADNIIRLNADPNGSREYYWGITLEYIADAGNSIVKVYNNILYGWQGANGGGSNYNAGIGEWGTALTYYIYNNTTIDCSVGIYRMSSDSSTIVADNNLTQNGVAGFYNSTNFSASSGSNITNISAQDGAFGATAETGTTTSTGAGALIDSGKTFTSTVKVGMIVANTTDDTYSYVAGIISDTQLLLANDIMATGENYTIYTNMYGSPAFADEANSDFHLDSSDTVAKNTGANLYADGSLAITTDIDGNARPNSATTFDIGADENIAKIYRSVGPSATSALSTGTSNNHTNHLTVSGLTATFELPLPDNVGVGDALQYDANGDGTIDAIAFIDKRFSNQQYRIKATSGAAPTVMSIPDTDWGLFRSYSTLNAAVNTETPNSGISGLVSSQVAMTSEDIVASQIQYNAVAYANGTTADTTAATIDGWTTSADSYLEVYTPTGVNEVGTSQRHSGKWDDNKYHLDPNQVGTDMPPISINADYVRVEGLQINARGTWSNIWGMAMAPSGSSGDVRINSMIIKGSNYSNSQNMGIEISLATDIKVRVNNSVVYGFTGGSAPYGIASTNSAGTVYAYNNTIYGCTKGLADISGVTFFAKNNLVSATDAFYGTFSDDDAYNDYNSISENTNDPPIGSHGRYNQTFTFVSTTGGSEDFHLAPSDAGAKNFGTDLSNDSYLPFNTDVDDAPVSYSSYPSNVSNTANFSRPTGTTWDIGADEVITKIYRSVAPEADGNLDSLATGGSNSMSVSATTSLATFTNPLPDNIGVGDVLQYDSNASGGINAGDIPVFITARTSSTVYTVKTATGAPPTTRAGTTTWDIFRAYTSLSNAEAGTENTALNDAVENFDAGNRDIKANSEQWNFACYANGTNADTTATTIDGWTTSPTNYIRVYTPVSTSEVGTSQRHSGKWDDSKYNIYASLGFGSAVIDIREDYVRLEGLQVEVRGTDTYIMGIFANNYYINTASDIQLSSNIVRRNSDVASFVFGIIAVSGFSTSNNPQSKIWNNIVYGFNDTSNYGIDVGFYGNPTSYLYDNTVVDCTWGILADFSYGSPTVVAKNNIVKGSENSNTYTGTFAAGTDYNATDGTDAIGQGSNNKISQIFSFADAANSDYHLASTDTAAKDAGADLSTDPIYVSLFTPSTLSSPYTDIDGASRVQSASISATSSAAWDIGADEVATPIYRSLAPGATGDLNTSNRTVSISGSTATFSDAMPDNVGVGDAIQYDSDGNGSIDAVATISARISGTEFSVKSAVGGTPIPTPVFPSTPVLDDFNRTYGPPPSASWGTWLPGVMGQWKSNGSQAVVDSLGSINNAFNYWNTTYTDSEVYATLTVQHSILLYARMKDLGGTTPDGYALAYNLLLSGADNLAIYRIDNGAAVPIAGYFFATDPSAGDSFGLSAVGSTLTAYYKSGSGGWVSLFSVNDATYAGPGYTGIGTSNISAVLDNFGGGEKTTGPWETANVFRSYASLSDAEMGNENTGLSDTVENFDDWTAGGTKDADEVGRNLTTYNEQWNISAYGSSTTADSTATTIDGWTTGASNYLKIYTPSLITEVGTTQRHAGIYSTSYYYLAPASGIPLTISAGYVRAEGLQFYSTDNDDIYVNGATGSSGVYISGSIIKGNSTAGKYGVDLSSTGLSSTARIWNNIIYDYSGSGSAGIYWNDADWTVYIYNNTVQNCAIGLKRGNDTAQYTKNNLLSATDAFNGTFTDDDAKNDYNAISENTNDAAIGSHGKYNQTFAFIDETGDNFHLTNNDTVARNAGVNLHDDIYIAFDTDIDGEMRNVGGAWDIGADEAAGPSSTLRVKGGVKVVGGVRVESAPKCTGLNPSDCTARETFEGSNLCYSGFSSNCDSTTWEVTRGSPVFNSTTQKLQGSYSLKLYTVDSQTAKWGAFTASDEYYFAFWLYADMIGSGTGLVAIDPSNEAIDQCNLFLNANGTLTIGGTGNTDQTTAYSLSQGNAYYIKIRAKKGTGSNAECAVSVGTSGTSWIETKTSNNGTWTSQPAKIIMEGGTNDFVGYLDDLRLCTSDIHW